MAQAEIEGLRACAAREEIVLGYLDEAGFSQAHPNRSAWTPKKERHLIEAKRGKRLNVLAAMLSTGKLISAKFWETMTAEVFVGFLATLKEEVKKPLVIILDNASVHTAKITKSVTQFLEKQGVKLYFLPPYSPELNKIEKLWHLMKYTWMTPKCRDAENLEKDVGEILDRFGEKYRFKF